MRHPLVSLAALAACGALLGACGGAGSEREAPEGKRAEGERPNIVVIMADDMGFSDIGPYGGEIRTPNLDRMAAGGVRFRQFYNEAICSPTRAALLTGRYSYEVGMGTNATGRGSNRPAGPHQGYLTTSIPTIAEALRAAGYGTYMAGKWHVGEEPPNRPRQRGFDRYFGLLSGANSFYELLQEPGHYRQMMLEDELWTPPAEGFYATDAFTDYAVERIREHRSASRGRPFFLYLAYTAPHFPLHALPEDIARYEGRYDIGWDSLSAERYARMRRLGIATESYELAPRPPSVRPFGEVKDRKDPVRRMEVYAAMVDRMDQGIGRVLKALEETGAAENTLVLFLSDNGADAGDVADRGMNDPRVPIGARGSYVSMSAPWAYASNTPFRHHKGTAYEGGIHTPAIAYWPGGIRTPGSITDEVAHVIDILPTALDLAGASYPGAPDGKELEGRSFAPVLRGEPVPERGLPLFWARGENWAIREGNWKLVHDGSRSKRLELIDLATDPTEMRDLSARHPERVAAMRATWQAWGKRVGVRIAPAD